MSHVLIVQGRPDTSERHFCHALADSCAVGALKAGHTVERLEIARIEEPQLQSQKEQESGAVVPDIANTQTLLKAADQEEAAPGKADAVRLRQPQPEGVEDGRARFRGLPAGSG